MATAKHLNDALGPPALELELASLSSGWQSPPALPDTQGLYALYDRHHLDRVVYIGKSTNLRQRVAQLFGATLTGASGLHSAGYKIGWGFAGRHNVKVAAANLVVHVWTGKGAYDQEAELIGRFDPPYNKQHVAQQQLTLKEPLGWSLKKPDRKKVWARVSATETGPEWSLGEWRGTSAVCTQQTDRVYFLGWNGVIGLGLWVKESGRDVFPPSAGESVARTVEGFMHVIDRWLEQRDEANHSDNQEP
jgi:hypothetical protein